jgi:hypothetical protein
MENRAASIFRAGNDDGGSLEKLKYHVKKIFI